MHHVAGPLGWIMLMIVSLGGFLLWRYYKKHEGQLLNEPERSLKGETIPLEDKDDNPTYAHHQFYAC